MRARHAALFAAVALVFGSAAPAQAAPAWLPDWETWKGIGSLGAVLISLAAFVVTWRTGRAKTLRELRDELRESIATLIELRSEFMKTAPTIADEEAREFFSATINTKKAIYLASAEHLARQLPYVTHAEWMVLATEYIYESNYQRAEVLLTRSVKAAETSSTTTRCAVIRTLAGAQMAQGAEGLARGRQSYRQAVALLDKQEDAYSLYTLALTYRNWSGSEYGVGNIADARERLGDALAAALRMPDWFQMKGSEVRQMARSLIFLTGGIDRDATPEAYRDILTICLQALQPMDDPLSRGLRAQLCLRLATVELRSGHAEAARSLAEQANSLSTPAPVAPPPVQTW